MNSARLIARRSQVVAKKLFSSQSARRQGTCIIRQNANRHFSTEAAMAPCQESLVKDAIKKMMSRREMDDVSSKPIEDEELERKFRHFQNVYNEAELCIADLKEAGDNFEDESQCANGAVENAFSAYVDLLEDLRYANEEQLRMYSDERLQNANNLKKLRQQVHEIVQNA